MHRGTSVWCSLALLALATALTGCAVSVHNRPSNLPLTPGVNPPAGPARDIAGENLVALSFSGGGLRAAAFSFGVIKALHAAGTPEQDVLSDVTMISSVSGGSLTAAYYGLHGPAALTSFRDKVLLRELLLGYRLAMTVQIEQAMPESAHGSCTDVPPVRR